MAERLDGHRKRQQQLYPFLTLTEMYDVLEKLRRGEEFSKADHTVYDAALVGIMRELHGDLDRAGVRRPLLTLNKQRCNA